MPCPGPAALRRSAVRRRDPRPRRRAPALRPCRLHRVPHRGAHRRPDQRSLEAGGVLPSYAGTIVRDGYKDGAPHRRAACLVRSARSPDLAALYRFYPDAQLWARAMLTCSSTPTPPLPPPAPPATLASRHSARRDPRPVPRRSRQVHHRQPAQAHQAGKDALQLARQFRDLVELFLQFTTDLAVFSPRITQISSFAPSRCSCVPPAVASAPCSASLTSPSFSSICPPPAIVSSSLSTLSPSYSPASPISLSLSLSLIAHALHYFAAQHIKL